MYPKLRRLLYWLIVIPGAVLVGAVVKVVGEGLLKEWDLRRNLQWIEDELKPRLPIEVNGETLLSVTHRGTTLTYTVRLNLDRPAPDKVKLDPLPPGAPIKDWDDLYRLNLSSPWAGIKQRVAKVVCANPKLVGALRDGVTLEYEYLDRRYLPAGSFSLTAGDCAL